MGVVYGTNLNLLVRSGLIVNLDVVVPGSYPGTGTVWYDLSGNNNNGTLVNMDGTNYSSANGGYFTFDGVNEGVSIPNLTLGSNDWTLEGWLYLSSGVTEAAIFSHFLGSSLDRAVSCYVSSLDSPNKFSLQHRLSDGSYLNSTGATTLSTETWYYFVATRSNDSYYTYINGVEDSSNTSAPPGHTYYTDNKPYYIGYNRNGVANLSGRIPTIRFYLGKSLTLSEIQSNFTITRPRYGV